MRIGKEAGPHLRSESLGEIGVEVIEIHLVSFQGGLLKFELGQVAVVCGETSSSQRAAGLEDKETR